MLTSRVLHVIFTRQHPTIGCGIIAVQRQTRTSVVPFGVPCLTTQRRRFGGSLPGSPSTAPATGPVDADGRPVPSPVREVLIEAAQRFGFKSPVWYPADRCRAEGLMPPEGALTGAAGERSAPVLVRLADLHADPTAVRVSPAGHHDTPHGEAVIRLYNHDQLTKTADRSHGFPQPQPAAAHTAPAPRRAFHRVDGRPFAPRMQEALTAFAGEHLAAGTTVASPWLTAWQASSIFGASIIDGALGYSLELTANAPPSWKTRANAAAAAQEAVVFYNASQTTRAEFISEAACFGHDFVLLPRRTAPRQRVRALLHAHALRHGLFTPASTPCPSTKAGEPVAVNHAALRTPSLYSPFWAPATIFESLGAVIKPDAVGCAVCDPHMRILYSAAQVVDVPALHRTLLYQGPVPKDASMQNNFTGDRDAQ